MPGPYPIIFRGCLLPLAFALPACEFGGEGGGSPGRKVPSSLTWMSTSLAKGPGAAKQAAPEGISVDTGDTYLTYRITPSNMEGRIIQASLMVGEPGAGKGGSALRLLGSEKGFTGGSIPDSPALPLFNMADKLTMASDFLCCGSGYPSDGAAYSAACPRARREFPLRPPPGRP